MILLSSRGACSVDVYLAATSNFQAPQAPDNINIRGDDGKEVLSSQMLQHLPPAPPNRY